MKSTLRQMFLGTMLVFAVSSCRATNDASTVANVAPPTTDCAAHEPVGDPVEWLLNIRDQRRLKAVFLCAKAPAVIPTGIGRGVGSVFAGLRIWNRLQRDVGSLIWGGKRFYEENGNVYLTNLMLDSGEERYNALVTINTSILDNKPTIILDYRVDRSGETYGAPATPAQIAVDNIATGIRDEIRELTVAGQGTGVYIGRAHLLTRYLVSLGRTPPEDDEFADPTAWAFGANFFLDFRNQ